MNKRLLCFLALLLTAVMGVWADEFVVDNVRYTITSEDPNEVTVSGYDGDLPADYALVIPSSVTNNTTDYAVTSIGDGAFSDCTSLSSITLAEGLTTIGGYAFYNCGTIIESVTIPESVTSIGENAFNGTNVTNFYINNIPSKIAIGETPFKADGVTIHVFTQMQSTFENATNWSAYTGHFNADIAISHVQSITLDNESMIMKTNTSGKLNATINPADARVKDAVFTSSNDNIIHITNAATGEFITGSTDGNATITCTAMDGSGKYASCTVTVRNIFTPAESVTLNMSEKSIEVGKTFKLIATINPANATYKDVTWRSSDENVATVDNNGYVTAIAPGVATITAISHDGQARANCVVSVVASGSCGTGVTWTLTGTSPNYTLTISGTGAIQDAVWGTMPWNSYKSSITTLIIEDGVTSIGVQAFKNHENLASINIANSVTTIGGQAFERCFGLTEFTVPDGVTNIDGGAFNQCLNMETFNIGTGLASINNSGIFLDCDKLATFTVAAGNTAFKAEGNVLLTYDGTELVAYPIAKTATSYTIPDGVSKIRDHAFYKCTNITEVTIPASVTTICYSAFYNCTNLETFNGYSGVTSVGMYAFYNTAWLDAQDDGVVYFNTIIAYVGKNVNGAVTIENGTKTIADGAFADCDITSITIPASVTTIGTQAFDNCTSLKTVTFEAGSQLATIGESVFDYCSALEAITIPAGVTTIGNNAFNSCADLVSVTFAEGSQLETIGEGVFFECSALTSITIPASVTTIGDGAFYECTKLATVTLLPATPPSIGDQTFYYIGKNASSYKKFYFHGTAYGTDTYSDWNNMYKNENDFDDWTTTVIGTLTLSEGTTTSTAAFVSDATSNYYTEGTTITLGHGEAPEGKVFSSYTVKDANDNDVTVTKTADVYTFDMPAGDVTATVNWIVPISYIDADGTTKNCTDYTVLTGEESELDGGWYVVNDDVTYTGTVTLNGDVNIILCDGKTMNVGTATDRINSGNCIFADKVNSLTIYGQALQTGTLNAFNSDKQAVYLKNYIQHGGNVTIDATNDDALRLYGNDLTLTRGTLTVNTSANEVAISFYNTSTSFVTVIGGNLTATSSYSGIYGNLNMSGGSVSAISSTDEFAIYGNLTVSGGTLTTTGDINGDVTFTGGTATIDGDIWSNATLGWTNADDRITASSYLGTVTIADGKSMSDGTTTYNSGTLNDDQKADIAGKTLQPAIPYIGADGTTAYCTDFTVLTGSTKSVTLGSDGETTWYVVNSDVNYKTILLIGNVNFILCDGMTMTSDGGSASAIRRYKSYNNSLTIYGQSAGTGKLVARCGEGNGISSDDITINGGTVDANGSNYPDYSAIYASGNVTISGGNVRATGYPKGIEAGGTITLGWTNATDRIYSTSYSGTVIIKDGQVFTDGNGNNFFGTITDVSTIADKTLQPAANSVFYIDADGTTKCCTNYKVLTGEESELDGGWYVVNDDVTYTGTVTLNGDVNIILCDSKTMNIGTKQSRISDSGICEYDNTLRILNIYGQSGQTGRLNVYNDDSNKAAVDLKSYNQYGGNVNIDANHTALSLHDSDGTFELSLQRGTLTVTAANGKDAIKCNTVVYGVLMEGGTLAATSIGGTAINGRVNFRGGTLTANGGDSGCGISGYVSLIPYSGFDSFTASSFNSDVSIAYGKSVSDGTTIYTNSNQSEIKSLKNVTLTLPTCSMTGNSVVTGEYWSTFYHPTAAYQVDANTTTAYIATLNSEETALTLTEVEGGFIPAGNAVILKSTTSSYDITRAETGDAFDFTTNSLLGGGKVNPTYDVYTLAAKDGVVGFYKFTGTSLNPYKAHLECAPADSRDYYGLEDDGTTRIEPPTISPEGERPDVWYDLNGRRIEKPTRKGIYIHNGRKEVLK